MLVVYGIINAQILRNASTTGAPTPWSIYLKIAVKAADNLENAIESIKEQLCAVPKRGYLSGDADITSQLSAIPQPEVSFNYLGQFD